MNEIFDPNWYAKALGMPLFQMVLFPLGTLIILFFASRGPLENNGTLVKRHKSRFIGLQFSLGFGFGGLLLVVLISIVETLAGVSISPLPEYFGLDQMIIDAR